MHKKKNLWIPCGIAAVSAILSNPAAAHGAPEFPISRQYNCYFNKDLPACKAAIVKSGTEQSIYDWNGVNQAFAAGNHSAVVRDGNLCAGGQSKFEGFDLARTDWQATPWSPGTDGKYEFRYNATAPHATQSWKFYLTNSAWKPGVDVLKWSDLELVTELGPNDFTKTQDKRYHMKLSLPQRTGQHVLFVAWQRSDSGEAFYSCSDVSFGGVANVAAAVPSSLTQMGQVSAKADLPTGSTARLRVFSKTGADLETIDYPVDHGSRAAKVWLARLAATVNVRSAYVRIGALEGGVVNVPSSATTMQVYAVDAKSGVTHALDTILPTAAPPAASGPVSAPATPKAPAVHQHHATGVAGQEGVWAEGASFKVGQIVSHKGRRYACLQAHTAWVGAGWAPDAPTVVNVLWKEQP